MWMLFKHFRWNFGSLFVTILIIWRERLTERTPKKKQKLQIEFLSIYWFCEQKTTQKHENDDEWVHGGEGVKWDSIIDKMWST